jgi:anti-anti-sigma factor
VLLHAAGTIDAVTKPVLSAALRPFRQRRQRLILDLRDVAHIEQGGLELLMAVADELNAVGGQLRLIAQPGSEVERTLRTVAPDRRVPVSYTVPEALAGRIS